MKKYFAGKSVDYATYRTDYPEDVIAAAQSRVGLVETDIVADLGSGTGMLARWFLLRGNPVFGVEPDEGMRATAEAGLGAFGRLFRSVSGTAERTTLPAASVSLVSVGNAFHYFDSQPARAEVARILRPRGRILIVDHLRPCAPNAFMRAYSDFVGRVRDAEAPDLRDDQRTADSLQAFFQGMDVHEQDLGDRTLNFTWNLLRGRFLSTSIAPAEGDTRRAEVLEELALIHETFQTGGVVPFQLRWRYMWSEPKPAS